MRCPGCGKNLGDPTEVDLSTKGWSCVYCGLKIYKDKKR